MQRIERLYAVNEAIRRATPAPVSAASLAREFEVSRRTIERDIAALRAAGMPLFAESGRTGGHRTLEETNQVVLSLSVSEVSALVVALAASAPDQPFADSGRTAVARLLDTLPSPVRVGVEELRNRVRTQVDDRASAEVIDRKVCREVERAVHEQRVINLAYVDAHGNHTERAVEPVGFLGGETGWALIGWCQLRDAGRLFLLDRIQSANLTTTPSPPRNVDEVLGHIPFEVAVA